MIRKTHTLFLKLPTFTTKTDFIINSQNQNFPQPLLFGSREKNFRAICITVLGSTDRSVSTLRRPPLSSRMPVFFRVTPWKIVGKGMPFFSAVSSRAWNTGDATKAKLSSASWSNVAMSEELLKSCPFKLVTLQSPYRRGWGWNESTSVSASPSPILKFSSTSSWTRARKISCGLALLKLR